MTGGAPDILRDFQIHWPLLGKHCRKRGIDLKSRLPRIRDAFRGCRNRAEDVYIHRVVAGGVCIQQTGILFYAVFLVGGRPVDQDEGYLLSKEPAMVFSRLRRPRYRSRRAPKCLSTRIGVGRVSAQISLAFREITMERPCRQDCV